MVLLITKDLYGGMIPRNHGYIVGIVSSRNTFDSSYLSSSASLFSKRFSSELFLIVFLIYETLGQELILF
jgi:hypothetical protein